MMIDELKNAKKRKKRVTGKTNTAKRERKI